MRRSLLTSGLLLAAFALASAPITAHAHAAAEPAAETPGPKLETLLRAALERVDGTEIIVSRVTMPPHTSLPRHWHPGEEFAYVLEGSVILWQEGKEDMVFHAGEVAKVPLEQVHTAITKDEGTTILVFRVHEEGKPERVPVEGK